VARLHRSTWRFPPRSSRLAGLGAFLCALKSGQFDDLDGAANRILFDDD
jgi:hypothetical protein